MILTHITYTSKDNFIEHLCTLDIFLEGIQCVGCGVRRLDGARAKRESLQNHGQRWGGKKETEIQGETGQEDSENETPTNR